MDMEPAEGNVLPAWRELDNPIITPRTSFELFATLFSFKEMGKLGCLGILDINPFVGLSRPKVRGFLFGWPWNKK